MADNTPATPMETLRNLRGLKDIPLMRQFAVLGAIALAIAAGLSLFFWAQQPAYVPVYDGLSDSDAAAVSDALRAANIPYRVDPLSGAVTVPGDKLRDARMRAAAAGMPKGSEMGFEMLQQDPGLGTSQFIEGARYQLALETELARTVSALQPIKSARVHLALPKPSAFTQNREPPSASVLVELRPGRQLESGQVDAIQHMVASSVPNLTPSAVTVIDQLGRLLSDSDPNSEIGQSTEQYQYERRVEADYVRRIEELLAPMLGMGHVSAQVVADLDFSQKEEASESYRPDGSVVRSEQSSEDVTRAPGQPQGVPGALSNQPPPVATATPPNADGTPNQNGATTNNTASTATTNNGQPLNQSRSETKNYELDRTVSHIRHPVGRVRRLSVAVLVDDLARPAAAAPAVGADGKPADAAAAPAKPQTLSADELAKVQALVKQAVGFDASRGDTVTVENAPFLTTEVAPLPPLPFWKRPAFADYLRQGGGAIVVLVLILAVLRPLLAQLINGSPRGEQDGNGVAGVIETATEQAALPGSEAAQVQAQLAGSAAAMALAPPASEQRMAVARGAVAEDPKRVAQLVKTWVNEDG